MADQPIHERYKGTVPVLNQAFRCEIPDVEVLVTQGLNKSLG